VVCGGDGVDELIARGGRLGDDTVLGKPGANVGVGPGGPDGGFGVGVVVTKEMKGESVI
jgi:hypothetical protein